jgi:hypothetical protein
MTKATKTTLLIFRSILCIAVVLSLVFYFTTQSSINESKPITYTVKGESQSNWRGTVYKLSISYANRDHTIPVSRATSDSIDNDRLPLLYYNNMFDTVVYDYHLSLSLRVAFVIAILFSISFLIKPQIDRRKGG